MTATLMERGAAAIYDPFLALGERRGMRARRARLLAGARGRVLEIGAGTGLNLALYPPNVGELVLAEPDAGMRRLLERRVAAAGRPATVIDAPAEALPFADASIDTAVSTLVLCTVPDAAAAIDELHRVLAPGGRLLFVEHVRAESPRLGRWQDRLRAPWSALAAGCQCNRDTLTLLGRRFTLEQVEHETWRGMPFVVAPLVLGTATATA